MTNLEKIKEEIANMNEEEFYLWKINRSPWCVDIEKKNNYRYGSLGCKACASQWLKSKCEEPMPELKTGMFVEVRNVGYGVVVNDEIIFQDGTHDKIDDLKEYIVTIFVATCFIDCEDDVGVIWRRE